MLLEVMSCLQILTLMFAVPLSDLFWTGKPHHDEKHMVFMESNIMGFRYKSASRYVCSIHITARFVSRRKIERLGGPARLAKNGGEGGRDGHKLGTGTR